MSDAPDLFNTLMRSGFACLFVACISPVAPAAGTVPEAVVLAAGDVAQCDSPGAGHTGQLIQSLPYPVLALGDLAYPKGTTEDYAQCYEPTWGAFKERTYPAPGNHDYGTTGAAGYFAYFGSRAGESDRGYYSFDLGTWHIVSLNSNRELDADSAQLRWLEADLLRHRHGCVLAFWHHPRYSSGPHGNDGRTQAIWEVLHRHGVSVVLTGHDHLYERFAPMNAQGELDEGRGIRSFVVGTGGAKLYAFKQRHPLSQAGQDKEWGMLKLSLRSNTYAWEFLPVAGGRYVDKGHSRCNAR